MAETPFSPESGATSGGTAPEDGSQGSPLQPPADISPERAATASSDATDDVASLSVEPLSSSPGSASESAGAAAEPPAAPTVPASAVATTSAEPVTPPPAPVEPSLPPPGVAATITVPPLEQGESGGGGEWELLVERFTNWWNSGELTRQWQRIEGPLKGVALLVAVLLAFQLYATVVHTIDGIPLVSGLLELTGLIAVLRFSATRLLRSSDRQEVLAQVNRRWLDFRGRN